MSAVKTLITSGGGQLGCFLNEELSRDSEILSIYHNNVGNALNYNSCMLDLTNYAKLKEVFTGFNPDFVIHNAAISNNVLADKYGSEHVFKVNVKVPEYLAELANACDANLIYTSTDLVYDGNGKGLLKEEDKTNPVSLYAESKLQGENVIESVAKKYLILRTSLMYEIEKEFRNNHFSHIFSELRKGKQVKLFTDQYRSPMSLRNAAECMREIINKNITGEIINFGGPERLSRFELAEILCEVAGFDKRLIVPVEMKHLDIKYKVYDVSMDISKLKSYGINPINAENYFQRFFG